jgi:hypothetical protein
MIGDEVTYDRMLAAMTQMSVYGLRVPPRAD